MKNFAFIGEENVRLKWRHEDIPMKLKNKSQKSTIISNHAFYVVKSQCQSGLMQESYTATRVIHDGSQWREVFQHLGNLNNEPKAILI